jgi:hypothetical protein
MAARRFTPGDAQASSRKSFAEPAPRFCSPDELRPGRYCPTGGGRAPHILERHWEQAWREGRA